MIFRRLIALLLSLALLTGLTAVAAAEESAEDPVLITVNGRELRLSDAQPIYDYYLDFYADYGYDMEDESNLAVIRAFTSRELIWSALISQYAEENGLDVLSEEDEAQIAAANEQTWDDAVADYILYTTGLTDTSSLTEEEAETLRANAIAYFEAAGFSRESTLAGERESFITERVKAAVLEGEDTEVTEEDIAAYHASMAEEDRQMLISDQSGYGMTPSEAYAMYTYFGYELYYVPAGFRMVKHILLAPDEDALSDYLALAARLEEQDETTAAGEDAAADANGTAAGEAAQAPVTPEQVETARLAVIDSVRTELDAIDAALDSGISFDELIAQYSGPEADGTAAPAEGFMVSQDSLEHDSGYLNGVFALEQPGEISDPVVTASGVYLILYVSEVPEGPVPMTQEMHDQYLEALTADAEDTAFTAVLNQWVAEAEILYTEEGEAWRMDLLDEEAPAETAAGTDAGADD